MVEDKYIGLALSISSSIAIGISFIITKKGLNDAADRAALANASDGHTYLRNPLWWGGTSLMVFGEIMNFAAYTFAPPILVTPLGFLSVLIGAVLASFFLNERLGHIGRVGCSLCVLGAIIIVAHAPADKDIKTVDEILQLALQPGFLLYCFTAVVVTLLMIYRFSPRYGKKTPIVYMSICSLMGSLTVMASKGFGIAIKLTIGGSNQFGYLSTYVFGLVCAICILLQMNYFNKALDTFSTNVVNPIYYVSFTTATIIASTILFQGFNTTDPVNTVSLISGFLITFIGVHLLNLSIADEEENDYLQLNGDGSSADLALHHGHHHQQQAWAPHIPLTPRVSLTGRLSGEQWAGQGHSRTRSGSGTHLPRGHGRRGSLGRGEVIFHSDDLESQTPSKLSALQEEHDIFPNGDAAEEGDDGWPRGSVEDGLGDATELTSLRKGERQQLQGQTVLVQQTSNVMQSAPPSRAGAAPR